MLQQTERYWTLLQSYKDASEKSKSFQIAVKLTNGDLIESSALPTSSQPLLESMTEAVFFFEERGGISLWCGHESIVFIPSNAIVYTVLRFSPLEYKS